MFIHWLTGEKMGQHLNKRKRGSVLYFFYNLCAGSPWIITQYRNQNGQPWQIAISIYLAKLLWMAVYCIDINDLEMDYISLFHNLERTSSGKLSFCNKYLDTQHGTIFISNYSCNTISLVDILRINYTSNFCISRRDYFYGIFRI